MKIRFGKPDNGWIVIHLNGAEMTVSDVPCDSLNLLIQALKNLVDGSLYEEVDWSLEPQYATWLLKRSENQLILSLKKGGREPVIIEQGDWQVLVEGMISALTELNSHKLWREDSEDLCIWSWPFPSNDLKCLKEKFTRLNS